MNQREKKSTASGGGGFSDGAAAAPPCNAWLLASQPASNSAKIKRRINKIKIK